MWGLGVLIPLLGAVGALQVIQNPGEMRVTVGDTVALRCWVLEAEPWELLRLEWVTGTGHRMLCATRLHPTTPGLFPCAPRLRLAWNPPHATLSLFRVQGDDAGRYLCRVTLEV
ncbi:TMIG2 protein, partial [Nyctiprogne leucopyga]|nr:TMIG2 protein [Nyctiprogne leucopyga]